MAEERTEKEPDPVVVHFMEALMAHFDTKTQRGLGAQIKLENDLARKVQTWVKGKHAPGFHPTMQLLIAAGWLTPEGLRAYSRPIQPEATPEEAEQALRRVESAEPGQDGKAARKRRRG